MTDSNLKRLSMEEATVPQLRWFAETRLETKPPKSMSDAKKLRNFIGVLGWEHNYIEIPDSPAAIKEPGKPMAQAVAGTTRTGKGRVGDDASSKNDPRVVLTIPNEDKPGGSRPVPVAVNGKLILLPRNEEISIAYRYYEALKNAKETRYREVKDVFGNVIDYEPFEVPSYPFNTVRMPDEAEVKAWIKAQVDAGEKEQAELVEKRRQKQAQQAA